LNQSKAKLLLQEKSYIEAKINNITNAEKDLTSYIEILKEAQLENDQSLCDEIFINLNILKQSLRAQEIESLFSEELDHKNCFLEIHSGAGGVESDDWTYMLMRMYQRWIERRRFDFELIDSIIGEEAGIKSVTFKILGVNAFGWLKNEQGIHRLVRISPFNKASKRHTSFASVSIYPRIDNDIFIKINNHELRIDTYRSSGAGGQHVNTTDSAVRITHLPTKTVVQCQNNRSQHKNKEECMSVLKSKLYQLELKKLEQKEIEKNLKKTNIGWGNQIRSYVLHPYKMVKDLRTQYQTSNVNAVLDGDIDEFIYKTLTSKAIGKGLKRVPE